MNKPTALGVYIFAGGFTLGVKKHFNVLAHFEDGPFGTATVQKNMPQLPIHKVPASWPADDFSGVDLIYGNPPCAPWSAAGRSKRFKKLTEEAGATAKWEIDPRVECVRKQFSLLERLRPKFWVWESVARAYTVGRPFVDQLTEKAHQLGYSVSHVVVEGKYCGIASHRRRFFFVAHRLAFPLEHPGKPPATVGEAWDQLPEGFVPETGGRGVPVAVRRLLEHAGPGTRFNKLFMQRVKDGKEMIVRNEREEITHRPSFLWSRLDPKGVAPTVVDGGMLIHPTEARPLTPLEAQLLCGYPADYEFVGPKADQFAQISKAVLPPVAEWLSRYIAKAINSPAGETVGLHTYQFVKEAA